MGLLIERCPSLAPSTGSHPRCFPPSRPPSSAMRGRGRPKSGTLWGAASSQSTVHATEHLGGRRQARRANVIVPVAVPTAPDPALLATIPEDDGDHAFEDVFSYSTGPTSTARSQPKTKRKSASVSTSASTYHAVFLHVHLELHAVLHRPSMRRIYYGIRAISRLARPTNWLKLSYVRNARPCLSYPVPLPRLSAESGGVPAVHRCPARSSHVSSHLGTCDVLHHALTFRN
jgi:hypothetical protein